MSKAFVQTLPQPEEAPRIARNTIFPTLQTTTREYGEDTIFIHHAMRESLVFGLSYAVMAPYDVESASPITDRMLSGKLGRGFWSWEDLGVTQETDLPSKHLAGLAGRNSFALPPDMRSVSPRLAVEMMLASPTAVGRLVGAPVEKVLGLTGYGEVQDVRVPFISRMPALAKKRSGYSLAQSYLLDNSGVMPFSAWIGQHTLYQVTLCNTLMGLRETVLDEAVKVYEAAGEPMDAEWLATLYPEVLDGLLKSPWQLQLPAAPEEEAAPVIIRRLLIRRLGAKAQFTGAALLRLGELTGISPAAFVRYAIKDVVRRGETYITAEEVYNLSDLSPARVVDELVQLACELSSAAHKRGGWPDHGRLLEILRKAASWAEVAPEWGVGRPLHAKQLSSSH
jgi:hypothetical protein